MKIFLFIVLMLLIASMAALLAIRERPAEAGAVGLAAQVTLPRVAPAGDLAREAPTACSSGALPSPCIDD